MVITLNLKEYKNLEPALIDIHFLTDLVRSNLYLLKDNPDLWGSFLYDKRIFDFNLVEDTKSFTVYGVKDNLIDTNSYVSYSYTILTVKNTSYRNRNSSTYLDENE
jgi:hypothetical protein